VDVGAREEIYALMHRLAEGGAALLAATPDLQEALRLGDRVGVMRGGRLRLLRPTAETGEDELLAALLGSGDAGNADAGG
jgi:ribose transport system ATP-binding protein